MLEIGIGGDPVVGEKSLTEVVPGDRRRDGVDTGVGSCDAQRQRAAIRSADDAYPRVAGGIEQYLGSFGQPVDHGTAVGHFSVGVVDRDRPRARAEASGTVGQHGVAGFGERAGPVLDRELVSAESVCEQHRGGGVRLGQKQSGIEVDHLGAAGAFRYRDRGIEHGHVLADVGGTHDEEDRCCCHDQDRKGHEQYGRKGPTRPGDVHVNHSM